MANKRGRKRTTNLYFGPEEEEAVVRFLECNDTIERNAIYNKWLRKPFDKMIESIIRRYKLYRKGFTFEDLHSDTLSFLITKADKFKKESGKRAYSYYGTICKHYMLGLLINDDSKLKQLYSYDTLSDNYLENREDLQYEIDDNSFTHAKLLNNVLDGIKKQIEINETLPIRQQLNDNEKKVAFALIEIIEYWKKSSDSMGTNVKYNKNIVLETIRNYTNLNTKDIRTSMKKIKAIYFFIKEDGLTNGFNDDEDDEDDFYGY